MFYCLTDSAIFIMYYFCREKYKKKNPLCQGNMVTFMLITTQNPPSARTSRFDSELRHHKKNKGAVVF